MSYIGRVTAEELRRGIAESSELLADLPPGFRILADLDRLKSMDADTAVELGKMMELADTRGVATVVRVISDPRQDIGLNILAVFHYQNPPEVVNCGSMEEAARALEL